MARASEPRLYNQDAPLSLQGQFVIKAGELKLPIHVQTNWTSRPGATLQHVIRQLKPDGTVFMSLSFALLF